MRQQEGLRGNAPAGASLHHTIPSVPGVDMHALHAKYARMKSGGVAAPMFGWFAAAVSGAPIPYPRLLVTFLGPCLVWVPIPFVLVLLALLGERR